MRLWGLMVSAVLLMNSCGGNTRQQMQSPLHGTWACVATSSNSADNLRVHIDYTHRINSHTLKSATETRMQISQSKNNTAPQRVELLFNSSEDIVIDEQTIRYVPYSVNLVSIEQDDLNMLGSQAARENFLNAVRSAATARYHFEAEKLHLYFPESAMTSVCEPAGSSS